MAHVRTVLQTDTSHTIKRVQTVLGWLMFVLGIIAYLGAFAMGPGPTMGDDPKQATLFTVATLLLIGGLVLLLVL
jgi:hypothetical protein